MEWYLEIHKDHVTFALTEVTAFLKSFPLPKIWALFLLSVHTGKYHAMKAYWRSGGTIPRILDLGTRWR
jgi:hypothetical protein